MQSSVWHFRDEITSVVATIETNNKHMPDEMSHNSNTYDSSRAHASTNISLTNKCALLVCLEPMRVIGGRELCSKGRG